MFDQIQGNSIKGFLRNNKMDSLIAWPNASSIYFITQDDGAYVGSSEAKSEKIEVHFENDKIKRIYYRVDVAQTTTPMKEVEPSKLRLSRFVWRDKERPASLEAFLNGVSLPHPTELFGRTNEAPTEDPEPREDKQDKKAKPASSKKKDKGKDSTKPAKAATPTQDKENKTTAEEPGTAPTPPAQENDKTPEKGE